ncbi:MAG TPA: VOC family protein [Actinomycetota bacterium]|nr:VOC family protein [Actinomycetota bacterium]
MVKAIPDGYPTVTPYLAVQGAAEVMAFLEEVFGASVRGDVMRRPDATVGHAELQLGDSLVMVGDTRDEPSTNMLHVYVEDCDVTYRRALAAGAESTMEPEDQFYGDRMAGVRDKWGNQWYIATHIEDVPADEMARRAQAQYES